MICSVCRTIFGADRRITLFQTGTQAVTPFVYPHYQSGESLSASVQAGCHICNLIWRRMYEDALLGAENGYRDGWIHDTSMVGSIWYSLIPEFPPVPNGHVTIYMTYGYGPNEIPKAAASTGEYPNTMIATTVVGKTVALMARPINTPITPTNRARSQLSNSTNSDHSWELARNWINECETSHPECSRKTRQCHWQPTRLINVEHTEHTSVRLQISELDSPKETYVSLSHCWGKTKMVRLLKSNIDAFQKAIPEHELSKTFQEAIVITRKLGYKFIWIDSLCIIQDSVEDWQQEAAIMGDVYRNAALNIAATSSSDGSGGCFSDRNPIIAQPCTMEAGWEGIAGHYQIHDSALWRHGVTRAPLNTRAWVVQEMSLAKRVLHFGKDQLFWECDHRMACEIYPEGIPVTQLEITSRIDSFLLNNFEGNRLRCFSEEWVGLLKPKPHLRCYDLWSNVVVAYTKCDLSHPTDKLIAISGLAKEIRKLANDQYLAGLWRKHLPHHLLWFVEKPLASVASPGAQTYCAPSWSWASTVGQVMDHPVTLLKGEKILIDILDVHVETATADTTGQCVGGSIKLRGILKPVQWSWIPEDELYSIFLNGDQLDFSIAFPDRMEYVTSDTVFCLPIHALDLDVDEPRLYGLVLKMVDETCNTLKRLGQFKVDFDHCSTIADFNLQPQEIVIV